MGQDSQDTSGNSRYESVGRIQNRQYDLGTGQAQNTTSLKAGLAYDAQRPVQRESFQFNKQNLTYLQQPLSGFENLSKQAYNEQLQQNVSRDQLAHQNQNAENFWHQVGNLQQQQPPSHSTLLQRQRRRDHRSQRSRRPAFSSQQQSELSNHYRQLFNQQQAKKFEQSRLAAHQEREALRQQAENLEHRFQMLSTSDTSQLLGSSRDQQPASLEALRSQVLEEHAKLDTYKRQIIQECEQERLRTLAYVNRELNERAAQARRDELERQRLKQLEFERQQQLLHQQKVEEEVDIVLLSDGDDEQPALQDELETAQGSPSIEAGSFERSLSSNSATEGEEEEEVDVAELLAGLDIGKGDTLAQLQLAEGDSGPYCIWLGQPRPSKYQLQSLHSLYRHVLQGPPEVELVKHQRSAITLRRRDVLCMEPRGWLNDEVINLYMALLLERDQQLRSLTAEDPRLRSRTKDAPTAAAPSPPEHWRAQAGSQLLPRCHFMNSFFVKSLVFGPRGYDYAAVRRWTLPKRLGLQGQTTKCLLDLDLLIVPVHLGNHWVLAVLYMQTARLEYYDSLKGSNEAVVDGLLRWVADEAKDKQGREVDTSAWERMAMHHLPGQKNSWDCGMFTLLHANYAALQRESDFDQGDMGYLRERVVADLLRLKVGL